MKVFVQWYNHDHRHSRIKFVTPQQRHTGEDIKLLKKRQRLYSKMMKMYPARWSTTTRNWPFSDPGLVNLSVRCVPEAEVNPGALNDRYRERKLSKIKD